MGYSGNTYYGYDAAGILMSNNEITRLESQAVAAYATPGFWVGKLGLLELKMNLTEKDQPPGLLSHLKEAGHIPSLSFGYSVGASYRE